MNKCFSVLYFQSLLQDVPLLSCPALMARAVMPAVQTSNTVQTTKANVTTSAMAVYMDTEETFAANSGINHSSYMDSWSEGYIVEPQFAIMEDMSLSDDFLHQYYSQVRNCDGYVHVYYRSLEFLIFHLSWFV